MMNLPVAEDTYMNRTIGAFPMVRTCSSTSKWEYTLTYKHKYCSCEA